MPQYVVPVTQDIRKSYNFHVTAASPEEAKQIMAEKIQAGDYQPMVVPDNYDAGIQEDGANMVNLPAIIGEPKIEPKLT